MRTRLILSPSAAALLLLVPALICIQADAMELAITAPQPGQAVSGMTVFCASADVQPGGGIEFHMGGRRLCGPIAVPPYRLPWDSELFYNGEHTVQAIARDAAGQIIAQSTPVTFTVMNGQGSLRLVSPDLSSGGHGGPPLQGTVQVSVLAEGQAAEALMFFIDGEQVGHQWGTGSGVINLDTARFANGSHELLVTAWAAGSGAPFGMIQRPFAIDNGRVPRMLLPRWNDLHLFPGGSGSVSANLLHTDGWMQSITGGAGYTSADPTIASVSANGTVTAVRNGVTTITISAGGRTAATRVIVDSTVGFPHFGRAGQILTAYDPQRSFFMRTLFSLSPYEVVDVAGMADDVRAAAVNTLSTGFYSNPFYDGQTSLDAWISGWDYWWQNYILPPGAEGFSLCFSGDDIARTVGSLHDSITNPWAPDAIRHALTTVRNTGRAVCIEMIDETSMLWGSTPKPTDGRWLGLNPPIPDDAFITLMNTMNSVPNRTPLSWPVLGIHGNDAAANWMGDPAFADYASHYWDITAWRRAYGEGAPAAGPGWSLPQLRYDLDRVMIGRHPYIQRNKPILLLTNSCDFWYKKEPFGEDLTKDQYLELAWQAPPAGTAAQAMYAATMGCAGIRTYSYDGYWQRERDNGGWGDYQIGASPAGAGTDRWHALASAFNLIQHLEPHLLQQQVNAVCLGKPFATGARRGASSSVLLAVSFSEAPEAASADLQPYRFGGSNAITRFRLFGATLKTENIADTGSDSVTFAPGESIVWLLKPQPIGADAVPPQVAIVAPAADSAVSADAGTSIVQITVSASDDIGIARVEAYANGRLIGTSTAAPHVFTWDARTVRANVWHSISARACDAAGNVGIARIAVRPTTLRQKLYRYWTLSIQSPTGSGSTSPGVWAHDFELGAASAPITATAASGWMFSHWTGTAAPGNPTGNPIVIPGGALKEIKQLRPVFVRTRVILEGPDQRGEQALPAGVGQLKVDIYVENMAGFAGFQAAMDFARQGGSSHALPIALAGTPEFGGLKVTWNHELLPDVLPIFAGRDTFGLLSISADKTIAGRTWLASVWYEYGSDLPTGTYTISVNAGLTEFANGGGAAIPCAFTQGSFRISERWTLRILPPQGNGTTSPGSGDSMYAAGLASDPIGATPAAGWQFSHWEGGAVAGNPASNPITIAAGTANQVKELRAVFVRPRVILEGPAERGEGPLLTGSGQVRIDLHAENFIGFAGFQAALRFVPQGGSEQTFLIALSGPAEFGGLQVSFNEALLPNILPVFAERDTFGLMLIAGDKTIMGRTWLASVVYDYTADAPAGVYTVGIDPNLTAFANGAGAEIACTVEPGSFSLQDERWTLQILPPAGEGTVLPDAGVHEYAVGAASTPITATPSHGWQFSHWEGSAVAGDIYANPITIATGANGQAKQLRAVFARSKVILQGPFERGEGAVPAGAGEIKIDVYVEMMRRLVGFQAVLDFASAGSPCTFPIALGGPPDFDGRKITWNQTLLPSIMPVFSKRDTFGLVSIGPEASIGTRTWLASAWYEYTADARLGQYTVGANGELTVFGDADGKQIEYDVVPASFTIERCPPGDINADRVTNILDLIFIRGRMGGDVTTGDNWKADANEDGRINILDLVFVRNLLGQRCGEP